MEAERQSCTRSERKREREEALLYCSWSRPPSPPPAGTLKWCLWPGPTQVLLLVPWWLYPWSPLPAFFSFWFILLCWLPLGMLSASKVFSIRQFLFTFQNDHVYAFPWRVDNLDGRYIVLEPFWANSFASVSFTVWEERMNAHCAAQLAMDDLCFPVSCFFKMNRTDPWPRWFFPFNHLWNCAQLINSFVHWAGNGSICPNCIILTESRGPKGPGGTFLEWIQFYKLLDSAWTRQLGDICRLCAWLLSQWPRRSWIMMACDELLVLTLGLCSFTSFLSPTYMQWGGLLGWSWTHSLFTLPRPPSLVTCPYNCYFSSRSWGFSLYLSRQSFCNWGIVPFMRVFLSRFLIVQL